MGISKSTYLLRLTSSLSEAPFVLKALLLFSLMTVAFDFYLNVIGPREIKEAIMPFTGWQVSQGYLFVAILLSFIITGYADKPFKIRNGIAFIFAILVLFGSGSFLLRFGAEVFNNPYTIVSPWRPVWTIFIPAIWVAFLYTPRVSKYCEHYRPIVRW